MHFRHIDNYYHNYPQVLLQMPLLNRKDFDHNMKYKNIRPRQNHFPSCYGLSMLHFPPVLSGNSVPDNHHPSLQELLHGWLSVRHNNIIRLYLHYNTDCWQTLNMYMHNN